MGRCTHSIGNLKVAKIEYGCFHKSSFNYSLVVFNREQLQYLVHEASMVTIIDSIEQKSIQFYMKTNWHLIHILLFRSYLFFNYYYN